ncbi:MULTISPECIES: hypothetical protein [unclassified Streptomyces]|uniref:hypothetical protein n=1 Tax=unclassified Streptomyces TaxID=2593676 RepID=UPI003D736202
MYAVKVVLLPPPGPAFAEGPAPPDVLPGDRWLDDVTRLSRAAPRPGIAHVSPVRRGTSVVVMTFVEAPSRNEATVLARHGWEHWLTAPGPLSGWTLDCCAPDPYLNAPWQVRPARAWPA